MNVWRDIVDGLPDAVIVLSSTREPTVHNAAAEALLGGSRITQALTAHLLEANDWLARMVESCLSSGHSLDSAGARLVLEKRTIAVRAQVAPLLGRRGEIRGVIMLLSDLSHQRGIERALEADDLVVRLSPAGLAHEVRNPLTGIKGAAELLASQFRADPRAVQFCDVILDGVKRITSMVEQVLAVSTPKPLRRAPVNIHQVLHQALRMAGLFDTPPAGIVVEQIFDPSLPELSADSTALERVFLNLLRNAIEAIQATPAGRGRIRVRTAIETEFRLSSHGRRRQFLRVEVSDSGKGMTADEMQQLFTPFFTTKAEGTGLGLVLSHRTVALHGGKLWAQPGGVAPANVSGQGNAEQTAGMTFCVILPCGPE
jgi:two-component system nitrogen regulation sensor histidine kinase GlnL